MTQNGLPAVQYRRREIAKGHERGWSFTELNGKRPVRKKWQSAPRETLEDALALAQGNVGLRTGAHSQVVVIDEDTAKGGSVAALKLPRTVTVETGGGGRHYYFKRPSQPVSNSAGKLAPQVDVRGDGGAVAFPGSVHPDTGRMYSWAEGLSPDDVELAELPGGVLDALVANGVADKRAKGEARAERIVLDAIEKLRRASDGRRNDTLNRTSFRIGKLVGSGDLDEADVRQRLLEAAHDIGLRGPESDATIRSGLGAGIREARAARKEGLPVIRVEGGDLPEVVDSGERAMMAAKGFDLYEFGGIPVRLVREPASGLGRRSSPASNLKAVVVDALYIAHTFTSVANWERWDGRKSSYKSIDCPPKVAGTYLSLVGSRRIPPLVGIISAPTLRADGSVLDEPGYDPVSKLFYDPRGLRYGQVPAKPTCDDAKRALAELKYVLKDFPFVAPHDEAVMLSAILTALARKSLRTAPMFPITAPKMSSGKSLLVDVVSLIATGSPAAVMSQAKDEEEARKRILALLLEGELIVSIDNIERPLADSGLCSILTQEVFKDRVLGVSKTATVPTTACWFATGNNLVIAGDLTTRVVTCALDPQVERPEERKFDINLHSYVRKHRARLVVAGLTVLRAYHVAGRPKQGLPVFGRFEEWSDWVRSALVWCGEPDPCLGRNRVEQYDPVRELLRAAGTTWHAALADTVVSAAQILQRAGEDEALKQALLQVGGGEQLPNPIVLGRWLHRHKDRIEDGLVIRHHGTKQGTGQWRIEQAREGSRG